MEHVGTLKLRKFWSMQKATLCHPVLLNLLIYVEHSGQLYIKQDFFVLLKSAKKCLLTITLQ